MLRNAGRWLKRQWDTVASIVLAIALSILAALDKVDAADVPSWTLGILALVAVSLVREREERSNLKGTLDSVKALAESTKTHVESLNDIYPIPYSDISAAFDSALSGTALWRYRGGTGTFLRAVTLPRIAKSSNPNKTVDIEILDPNNVEICRHYANYRQGLLNARSATSADPWTPDRVRLESLATIVAAYWYHQTMGVRVRIGLSSTFSTFRYDMSNNVLIITSEDKSDSALKAPSGGTYYARYAKELTESLDQASSIDVSVDVEINANLDATSVRTILATLEQAPEGNWLCDNRADKVAKLAISAEFAEALNHESGNAKNPYPPDESP